MECLAGEKPGFAPRSRSKGLAHVSASERINNTEVSEFMRRQMWRDIGLYQGSKDISLVDCSAIPNTTIDFLLPLQRDQFVD
jgi:hypothetical protein